MDEQRLANGRAALGEALTLLSERERRILIARRLVEKPQTLCRYCADEFGVSCERISPDRGRCVREGPQGGDAASIARPRRGAGISARATRGGVELRSRCARGGTATHDRDHAVGGFVVPAKGFRTPDPGDYKSRALPAEAKPGSAAQLAVGWPQDKAAAHSVRTPLHDHRAGKKSPAEAGLPSSNGYDPRVGQILSIALSFVSGRNSRPTKKLIAATTIGYHRPE